MAEELWLGERTLIQIMTLILIVALIQIQIQIQIHHEVLESVAVGTN